MFEVAVILTGSNPDIALDPQLSGYFAIGDGWDALDVLDAVEEWIVAAFERFNPVFRGLFGSVAVASARRATGR